ncbi:MAG: RNA-binding protein, partial [Candidatus Saccharimonadales bacterium]
SVVRDRDTGRSKGFGFVEFENDEEGKAAEKALNGSDVGGRNISVAEARPKEDRPQRNSW